MVINNRMRCLVVTLMRCIRFIGFAFWPSRDSVAFTWFVCWCCLARFCLVVSIAFVWFHYFRVICLLVSPSCDLVTFSWFVCWRHLRVTLLVSHDLFLGVAFVRLCYFHVILFVGLCYFRMICLLATHSYDFVWLCAPRSCDFITFTRFVCWRHLHVTLFGCECRVRAISLLSRDLFVVIAFMRLY
jgi:hypothetical protein